MGKNIHQFDDVVTLDAADEVIVWDAETGTTRKATIAAVNAIVTHPTPFDMAAAITMLPTVDPALIDTADNIVFWNSQTQETTKTSFQSLIDEGIIPTPVSTLSDLTDVTTSGDTSGEVLTYDGANYVNAKPKHGNSGNLNSTSGILTVTRADDSTIQFDLSNLQASGGAAGVFLGYTQNGAQMDLLSPIDLDITIRTDSNTVWQYQTNAWVNTGQSTINLESIVANVVAGIPTIPEASYATVTDITGGIVGVGADWANTGSTGHNLNTVKFDNPIQAGDTDKWFTWTALPGTGGGPGHNFAVGLSTSATSANLGNGTINAGFDFALGHYGSTGGLWYYGPNSGIVGAGYIWAMPYITGGGDFRIGIDTDGFAKWQFFRNETGAWTSIAKSASSTIGASDDLYLTYDLYNGPAQGSTLVTAPEAPYASTASAPATGDYADTHYINHDGTNDHVTFNAVTDDFMDWNSTADWSIGWTWDGRLSTQPQNQSYMTLFSNGSNQIGFRQGGSNQGIYCRGSSTSSWGINTWYAPVLGDKYLMQFNRAAKTITFYRNNVVQGTINAVHLVNTYNGATGDFTIGKGAGGWSYFDGGMKNVMLRSGTHLGSAQRAEYFGQDDLTTTSFYNDVETIDFLRIGEEAYPAVNGLKGAVLGTYTNGTAADYVEK